MFVFAPQNYTTLQRNNLVSNLGQIAQYCSQTENLACEVERAVSNYKLCEYMGNYLGQTFSGIVVNLNNKGFYVQLNNGIEGFTLLFNSPLDFFEFNYDHYYLVGKNTGQKITLGTKVIVKLVKTDLKQRTIEFALEQIVSHS